MCLLLAMVDAFFKTVVHTMVMSTTYTQHTIAVTGINRNGPIPGYSERCGGIMEVTFSRDTFMEESNPVVG